LFLLLFLFFLVNIGVFVIHRLVSLFFVVVIFSAPGTQRTWYHDRTDFLAAIQRQKDESADRVAELAQAREGRRPLCFIFFLLLSPCQSCLDALSLSGLE
jgi:hypothetical protein